MRLVARVPHLRSCKRLTAMILDEPILPLLSNVKFYKAATRHLALQSTAAGRGALDGWASLYTVKYCAGLRDTYRSIPAIKLFGRSACA